MKTTFRKLMALAIVAAAFVGCSDDDNNNTPSSSFVVDANNFQGTIADGEVQLNAGTTYKLTGRLLIADGASLTIPAGTRIEGIGGTAAYIAVAQGGKIFVNGTENNPVVMTSGLATPAAGNWGGLVICGKAPINRVTGGQSTASAEVSELTYGGTVANDNSGVIRYLRVEYAGAAYNQLKEFNGISFFGVGSGTVVEYVQSMHGADDGFEFFGGTVNTKGLVAFGNEDDLFDWTEGWNGTNTDWYGKVAFGKGNRGIEADNYEDGFANTPVSNPTITNLTLIGAGSTADATAYAENDAIKLRRGTRGIFANVVLSGWKNGFALEHDETIAAIGTTLKATNVSVASDVTNLTVGKTTAGTSANVAAAVTEGASQGAGNGIAAPSWTANWTTGL
ncbi:hypothetical protein [Flavobacterium sp.]|uniref:hypothetical protein n=1 Tax=Flavobacterium sp. TaxID=239 RepID=UPI00121DE939|nr:hypothetical protein [Flavobacterium sp.]RZJ69163.1 MAG: hypothetical protein EOO49_18515 [Flavobacterium sp.]